MEKTSDVMARGDLDKGGGGVFAFLFLIRASRVKKAAGGKVDRIGHVSFEA